MPPPNVTGVLHLGHALENTLMDIMIRFQRMRGKKALLLPGTDHAAVATQSKVEKLLVEGKLEGSQKIENPREELGREGLLEKIRESYQLSQKRYGSPNIHADLRQWGYRCSRKRVARIMREAGMRAKTVKRFKVTTQSKHKLPVSDNLLKRDFTVTEANRVWVSDITYIWTLQGWMYLCVILDLWDHKVVGWSMEKRLTAELAILALRNAVMLRLPPEGLILHSDRGVQYASEAFRKDLQRFGMLQSMSRKGDCWDNAVAESFFSILKRELVYHETYRTRQEARLSVFEYIEGCQRGFEGACRCFCQE